jgi:DNA-directed RNA polymerase specialized sigma24 family protein
MKSNQPTIAIVPAGTATCCQEDVFLKIHTELSILGYLQLKDWLMAQDVATECLLEWCVTEVQDESNVKQASKKTLFLMFQQACAAQVKNSTQLRYAEQQFIHTLTTRFALQYSSYEEQREHVLMYLPHLPPLEATVIRLQLEEAKSLSDICIILQKPLQAIRLLHDRALYLLRKRFQPQASLLYQYR